VLDGGFIEPPAVLTLIGDDQARTGECGQVVRDAVLVLGEEGGHRGVAHIVIAEHTAQHPEQRRLTVCAGAPENQEELLECLPNEGRAEQLLESGYQHLVLGEDGEQELLESRPPCGRLVGHGTLQVRFPEVAVAHVHPVLADEPLGIPQVGAVWRRWFDPRGDPPMFHRRRCVYRSRESRRHPVGQEHDTALSPSDGESRGQPPDRLCDSAIRAVVRVGNDFYKATHEPDRLEVR
jgi:hypothetical protein